jgi:hypothetical protein
VYLNDSLPQAYDHTPEKDSRMTTMYERTWHVVKRKM